MDGFEQVMLFDDFKDWKKVQRLEQEIEKLKHDLNFKEEQQMMVEKLEREVSQLSTYIQYNRGKKRNPSDFFFMTSY